MDSLKSGSFVFSINFINPLSFKELQICKGLLTIFLKEETLWIIFFSLIILNIKYCLGAVFFNLLTFSKLTFL